MTNLNGFFSYVHKDDLADEGRITRFARDIVNQFEMISGESIELFLDIDGLEWGDSWKEKINSTLESVAFFIPVLTPRYFMSAECRAELNTFVRIATARGFKELLLPIYYVDIPELSQDKCNDDLINLVKTIQWEDWREIRFTDVSGEGYRRGVAKLAKRLVEANKNAEIAGMNRDLLPPETLIEESDESPGLLDSMALFEIRLDEAPITLSELTENIHLIGQIMNDATDETKRGSAQGHGFSAKLSAAIKAARRMVQPTENIHKFSNVFASQLHDIDIGIRIIIEKAPEEVETDPSTKENFCNFFSTVMQLSEAIDEAISSIVKMIESSEPLEKLSRDMRPVLRQLSQGLTILIESSTVNKEWLELIKRTDIYCDE